MLLKVLLSDSFKAVHYESLTSKGVQRRRSSSLGRLPDVFKGMKGKELHPPCLWRVLNRDFIVITGTVKIVFGNSIIIIKKKWEALDGYFILLFGTGVII